jgi:hypothetical protein
MMLQWPVASTASAELRRGERAPAWLHAAAPCGSHRPVGCSQVPDREGRRCEWCFPHTPFTLTFYHTPSAAHPPQYSIYQTHSIAISITHLPSHHMPQSLTAYELPLAIYTTHSPHTPLHQIPCLIPSAKQLQCHDLPQTSITLELPHAIQHSHPSHTIHHRIYPTSSGTL